MNWFWIILLAIVAIVVIAWVIVVLIRLSRRRAWQAKRRALDEEVHEYDRQMYWPEMQTRNFPRHADDDDYEVEPAYARPTSGYRLPPDAIFQPYRPYSAPSAAPVDQSEVLNAVLMGEILKESNDEPRENSPAPTPEPQISNTWTADTGGTGDYRDNSSDTTSTGSSGWGSGDSGGSGSYGGDSGGSGSSSSDSGSWGDGDSGGSGSF